MKIGIWNIDHPELNTRSKTKTDRVRRIYDFLVSENCDVYVLTETNSAINLAGYNSIFSSESPFIKKSRSYIEPNRYYQVGIYSRFKIKQHEVHEPINGVCCQVFGSFFSLNLFGNVITIKDQWKKDSVFKYKDRLNQQIFEINHLPKESSLVAGDFNLKKGWVQKASAFKTIESEIEQFGWIWPTKTKQIQYNIYYILQISK